MWSFAGWTTTIVSVHCFGNTAIEVTDKTSEGKVANELLYRSDETRFKVVENEQPLSFEGDGAQFRLVAEAHRIQLSYLVNYDCSKLLAKRPN